MKNNLFLILFLLLNLAGKINAQVTAKSTEDNSKEVAHSTLAADGIIQYLPNDTAYFSSETSSTTHKILFNPLVNFFFRPESTINYKEAGLPIDTGQFNFYLRGDFGGKISLPKNIDVVFNLQSFGTYTRSFGPLNNTMSLYEAYVDMKSLDRNNKLSLRFGRMCLGKYGTEILIGDDDFIKGRSFESVRLRHQTKNRTSDLIWVQLYQEAPDSAGFEWNHPLLVGSLNTFHFSDAINFDANLPFLITQINTGFNTSVLMPDVRFFGQKANIRYSAEIIYQSGSGTGVINENSKGKVNAYAAELSAGYFTKDNKICVDVSYYRASGDDQPGNNQIKNYNVLWQNEHRRFGYIDAFKGSNVQASTLHLNWILGRLMATGIHAVSAQVLESKDRSTGIATIASLNSITTTSKSIGFGGDWYLNYFFNHHLNMQFSASVFSPGEYFTAVNGLDKPMIRLYITLALKI